ncbi:phosphatidate cytidylyltransferase [Caldimonas thermodepolymerans]|jgi:CDP-diglyceride synthetase|uniref:Phosphatidate cytidylyltransferase n=1 Tax=Caldimonas thermodepolymerans TaxID=215580 RepID=A0A2S5T1R4_9BURK|nr:phosphatidate cytidylyltransferase [Caldimonas thermodepolymerans]PPE68913.1 phosphatidate cytidylyltransferase [Caldimonas thermodepolymerans]QPC30112.1 phosphatidate cytidylyltransferase [Caldimonas thermodepolymerans]RDI00489.1 phosphatidate cytidylyltransferase [Caldimonas thermodepolymerans]TCP07232.1 phosphatidate cytidylyltransferase [Caldimonas thermodepolymerans]UZG42865.1 phosphatidate cytidylyltransferase [Caldimonas thermodepolymerans]
MLKQRVITAVLLLAVLLPALFAAPVWPFAVLTLVAVAAAGWEWGRLNGLASAPAIGMGAGVAVICLLSWPALASLQAPTLWWIATVAWVLGGAWLLRLGPTQWPRLPQALRLLLGVGILWLTWLALTQSKAIGLNFLLSVFCLVWAADIAAYFGGRAFGKRKLAPAISPGKSWEGVWSGMAGVLLLAVLWIAADARWDFGSASLYTGIRASFGWVGVVVVCAFLAAMSVVGDLFESLIKRSVGAKDSSQLLPGHGGVLDRIDALLPVLPIALNLSLLR